MGHVGRPSHDQSKAAVLVMSGIILGKPVDFIIDSGAEKSVVPISLVPKSLCCPTSAILTGVDGNKLTVYGQFSTKIGVRSLRREFGINFIVTDTRAILGADFLTTYGLSLNMKLRTLTDTLTGISAPLKSSDCVKPTFSITEVNLSGFLAKNFPNILKAPEYSNIPSHLTFHEIKTSGGPVFSKPRPLAPEKFNAAKEEFEKLMKLGIVRPSDSPWSSPLHMVRKSDGSWRPCGDYRRLNSLTTPDRYATPNMNTIHHKIKGAKVFSKLDLIKAYHFIPLNKDDVQKTAITTPFGSFEYLRMPFGLRNAAATFQRFIDNVFRGLNTVVTYIDDILVFSPDIEQHQKDLAEVCHRLEESGLRINERKSTVFQNAVSFLGYEVNSKGIKPLPERVDALRNLPAPTDSKALQKILGMFGFYQTVFRTSQVRPNLCGIF